MNSAESLARNKIIRIYFQLSILGLIASLVLFGVGVLRDNISYSYVLYVILRIVIPSAINFAASFVAKICNSSENIDNDTKCEICSFACATIGASISFWNGYYVALWCLPILAVMFCSVFHDSHLLFKITVFSIITVAISAFYQMIDHPEQYTYYLESMLVVMMVLACGAIVSRNMIKYNKEMQNIVYEANEKRDDYRHRLETDQLTYLHTRPYAQEKADLFLLDASDEHPVSLAVVDLDFFKSINDTYGHKNGDVVLWKFGDTVNKNMIDNLVVGRYGGEEFIFVFDGGDYHDHIKYMDELREKFGKIKYKFTDRSVTFSCGIVTANYPTSFSDAFKYADQGVYYSKENGRNRVTAYLMPPIQKTAEIQKTGEIRPEQQTQEHPKTGDIKPNN